MLLEASGGGNMAKLAFAADGDLRRAKTRLTYISLFAAFSAIAFQAAGCRDSRGRGTGPLPPPPEQARLSDYQPEKAFSQISPGLATRTVFVVEPTAKDSYHVEVQDVIVAPGKEASIPLQGAATFEVTDGGGSATIGARSHELGTGSTFAVPEGEPLKIAAKGDAPMTLRAYVVRVP
jgi:mannose-6-phosphate isomerase-like protein (cupin superfamily)